MIVSASPIGELPVLSGLLELQSMIRRLLLSAYAGPGTEYWLQSATPPVLHGSGVAVSVHLSDPTAISSTNQNKHSQLLYYDNSCCLTTQNLSQNKGCLNYNLILPCLDLLSPNLILFHRIPRHTMDYLIQIINLLKRWFGLSDRQNFEDLFYQLIHARNYDEALKLAQQHKYLDVDLVYKCKWRNSGITVQSISHVLGSIQDKLWAINECVQTVPISYEACRTLIEFGLQEANLRLLYQLGYENNNRQVKKQQKPHDENKRAGRLQRGPSEDKLPLLGDDLSDEQIEGLIDFDNLNDQQKELCRCRQDLLRYEHSLLAYESILGDHRAVQQHFDHVFYDEFRQKCPLNTCIEYANSGDAHAVDTLLNFYTEDTVKHVIAIISNFPETISPYQYRNLLPCLREGEAVYEWRSVTGQIKKDEFDWSNRGESSNLLSMTMKSDADAYEKEFYGANESLKRYLQLPLDGQLLTDWYISRATEMESRTLLLSCAIQLLHLGSELNIKNLTETHDDLVEFARIIYDCCTDNTIYLSFDEFNKMPITERLLMMTGDSVKVAKDRFRFYVIPYLHRRDVHLGLEGKAGILRQYFERLAHAYGNICQAIYEDLLDKIECDNYVAEWTKELDDVIDEIGEEIKTIERNRQAKQLSTVAGQTMALGDYNGCYEACRLIIKKSFRECWALCCQLGMHKQYHNNEAKYKLLAFALAYCDDPDGKMSTKILDYVIELRKRDEKIQLAYLKQNM